jgi:hypothetical protein
VTDQLPDPRILQEIKPSFRVFQEGTLGLLSPQAA